MLVNLMDYHSFDLDNFLSARALTLPEGWRPGTISRGSFSLCHQFHPPDDDNTAIIVSSRGHKLADQIADRFAKILASTPHTLDDLERQRIAEVLDTQAVRARFALTSARTELYQGKTVLITEGTYVSNGDRAFTVFVDANDDGRWVEEFQYSAPPQEFNMHFQEALSAFKSISWQSPAEA